MKIALVNNLFFPFQRGGAEQVVSDWLYRLQNEGHEVFLIATRPRAKEAPKSSGAKIYWIRSRYYDLNRMDIVSRLIWHAWQFLPNRNYREIKKILEEEKPDLIFTHNLLGLNWRLPLLSRRLNIRQEHFLHDIQLLYPSGLMMAGKEKQIDSWPARLYQAALRSFFSSPDKIISPSRWLLEEHTRRGFFPKSATSVSPWTTSQTGKKVELGESKDFLFVGQIEEHKGIMFLIKAWIESSLSKTGHRLLVVGSGSKLEEAKRLAAGTIGIEFLGRREKEDLPALIKDSRCLIVPSLCYENSPTIIDLAHQNNRPVIAANLGGIPEMATGQDFLFAGGSQTGLIAALEKATQD